MSFTPTVTFNSYKKNGSTVDLSVYDESLIIASPSATLTQNLFIFDAFDAGTIESSSGATVHEVIYDVLVNSGTENYSQFVLSNGINTNSRFFGFDVQTAWASGATQITIKVQPAGGFSGSIDVDTTGINPSVDTTFIAMSGAVGTSSGSNSLDVPTSYFGSFVAVVDPNDWDLDVTHLLHDWQPVKVMVGHAVEIFTTNYDGGARTNNDMTMNSRGVERDQIVDFKTYHEDAGRWRWLFSGTVLSSGTHSGTHVDGTWDLIQDLVLHHLPTSGTYTYNLELFENTLNYTDHPVRTINFMLDVIDVFHGYGIDEWGVIEFGDLGEEESIDLFTTFETGFEGFYNHSLSLHVNLVFSGVNQFYTFESGDHDFVVSGSTSVLEVTLIKTFSGSYLTFETGDEEFTGDANTDLFVDLVNTFSGSYLTFETGDEAFVDDSSTSDSGINIQFSGTTQFYTFESDNEGFIGNYNSTLEYTFGAIL